MSRPILPRTIAAPASRYAHGVLHSSRAHRLVIAGQVGIAPDGTLPADFEGQMESAFDNLEAVLTEAGMAIFHLVRLTVYVTKPGAADLYRAIRDRRLGGHLVAATYLEVAGLADPAFMIEIDGEAVAEEPPLGFLDLPEGISVADLEPGVPPRIVAKPGS
jgi:enamine deaminase RidA (YjgF/YER057c/UK114 family)